MLKSVSAAAGAMTSKNGLTVEINHGFAVGFSPLYCPGVQP